MTLGMDRVRVGFNPSANRIVDDIKRQTANLIDLCHALGGDNGDSEVGRCLSLAMTHYEDAAMWAVKAATAEKK